MFTSLGNSISRSGLVGEWLLDGNALDTSGNGYNGTATNVTYVKTNRGYQAQAGSFNGGSSNVNLGTNKFPTLVNNCTFTAWIRNNSNSTTQSIFSNGNNGTGGDIGWYFGIKLDGANNTYNFTKPGVINENTGITPSVGRDDFICLTITSNIGRLYINSALVWTGVNSTAISNNTQTSKIGCHTINSSNTQFYNGNIQGVRIYNRILSQDEIQLLYLEGQKLLGPTHIAKYPKLFEGLVGYWDFRGTAHNLVDGVNATANTATLTTDRFGNSNSAYNFNGSNTKIVYPFSYTNNSDYTVSIWCKIPTNPTTGVWWKIAMFTGNNQIPLSLYYRNVGGVLKLSMTDMIDNLFTYDYNIDLSGDYKNIVVTKTGTTQRIYVNGVDLGITGNIGTSTASLSLNNKITLGVDRGEGAQWFNGVIDEFGYIGRALSADEVKLLYNLTSQDYIYPTPNYSLTNLQDGLLIHLNGTNNGTTTLYDISGNGINGTASSNPTYKRQGRIKTISLSSQSISWTSTSFTTSTCFEKVSGKWTFQVNPAYITTTGVSSGTREITDIRLYNRSLSTTEQEQLKYSKLGNFIY